MKLVVALHPGDAGARAPRHRRSRWPSETGASSILNPGPHGLTEVLYAFTSAANNNGIGLRRARRQHRLLQHRARRRDAPRPFLPIVLVLALAGSLAAAGQRARTRPAPCRPTGRSSSLLARRRRSSSSPGSPTSRPWRSDRSRKDCHDHARPVAGPSRGSRRLGRLRPARAADVAARRRAQARPAHDVAQPGHVRGLGRRRAHHRRWRSSSRASSPGRSPSGSGSRCCSPTWPRRSPRAGARPRRRRCGRPARDTDGPAARRRRRRGARSPPPSCSSATASSCEAGDVDPRRRRRRRGRRQRRRVGDHRRVRAGDPGVAAATAARSPAAPGCCRDRIVVADHRAAGRDLHRPDDRAGRGRQPAEDAERDRAQHPARRADDHLPARVVDPAAVRRSTRAPRQSDHRAGRPAGLPDPHDHRRAALGDRHRRHGPAGAAQRARDVGPRRRGGRRRVAPCCSTRPARSPSATGRRSSSSPRPGSTVEQLADAAQLSQPRRRDARGPLDRRARQGAVRPARARRGRAAARGVGARSPPRPA